MLAVAACTAAPAREAGPPSQRPTVVSLNPCTDAILAEVADPQQILAISSYSHDPAASSMDLVRARRFKAVSGSVEEVLALRPDLVVGSTFTPPASVQAMARLGLRFEPFGMAATVAESEAQVRQLAALAGHPERGERLVRRIEAALAANRSGGVPIPALVWQSGGIVPGDGTLIADLLRRTGFANAAARAAWPGRRPAAGTSPGRSPPPDLCRQPCRRERGPDARPSGPGRPEADAARNA